MIEDVPVATGAPAARTFLSGRAVPRTALGQRQVAAMYDLLVRNFRGVELATFQCDLAEKNWVVLLEDDTGALRGFSTFLMYPTAVSGRPLTVVYSGDTIVEPSAWGSTALPRAWIRAVYDVRRDYPEGDLYWLLLTSGFRTYRFMSVFCRSFYPRFEAPTPADAQQLLDALSAERFGAAYEAGLVRFPRPQVLRERLIGVPAGRCADPHVQFFLERNPGYRMGDELVSLACLAPDNLTAAGRRMARRGTGS